MVKTYLDKDPIPAVGVSKVRNFGGPVDLKIADGLTGVTDNFPLGLTADDLFGAIIVVDDGTDAIRYIADAVYDDGDGKVYFTLGSQEFYYNKSTGRAVFVET